MELAARFKLHVVCNGCVRKADRLLDIQEADEAPRDVEDLVDSGLLAHVHFFCRHCESQQAEIVGITQLELEEELLH